MRILAEVHPKKKPDKLNSQIQEILSHFDGVDVPDSPMGEPSLMPIAVGMIARSFYKEKEVIVNQRLADVNELFVRSLAITASTFNFKIAFTKGDPPRFGREVGYLSSEDAVRISRDYKTSAGLMLSFSKGIEEMTKRASKMDTADFFLLLRAYTEGVQKLGAEVIKKSIPYIIIRTPCNHETIKRLSQPFVDLEFVHDEIEKYKKIGVSGVLLSTLGNYNSMKEIFRKL